MQIFHSNLSMRVKCLLLHLGYKNIQDLSNVPESCVKSYQGFGNKCILEINRELLAVGEAPMSTEQVVVARHNPIWYHHMQTLRNKGLSLKQAHSMLVKHYTNYTVPSLAWFRSFTPLPGQEIDSTEEQQRHTQRNKLSELTQRRNQQRSNL